MKLTDGKTQGMSSQKSFEGQFTNKYKSQILNSQLSLNEHETLWKSPLRIFVGVLGDIESITIRVRIFSGDSERDFNARFKAGNYSGGAICAAIAEKERLSKQEAKLFSLWVVSQDLELQVGPKQDIQEVVVDWYKKVLKYTHFPEAENRQHNVNRHMFVYRREASVSTTFESNIVGREKNRILLGLLRWNYLSMRYPVTIFEASVTAAHLLHISSGNYSPTKHQAGFLCDEDRLAVLLPSKILHAMKPKEWEQAIFKPYMELSGLDTGDVIESLLRISRSWFSYGASFFPCCSEIPPSGFFEYRTQNWQLGVSTKGICVIDRDSSKYVHKFEWEHVRFYAQRDMFIVEEYNKGKLKVFLFYTPQSFIAENLSIRCKYIWAKEASKWVKKPIDKPTKEGTPTTDQVRISISNADKKRGSNENILRASTSSYASPKQDSHADAKGDAGNLSRSGTQRDRRASQLQNPWQRKFSQQITTPPNQNGERPLFDRRNTSSAINPLLLIPAKSNQPSSTSLNRKEKQGTAESLNKAPSQPYEYQNTKRRTTVFNMEDLEMFKEVENNNTVAPTARRDGVENNNTAAPIVRKDGVESNNSAASAVRKDGVESNIGMLMLASNYNANVDSKVSGNTSTATNKSEGPVLDAPKANQRMTIGVNVLPEAAKGEFDNARSKLKQSQQPKVQDSQKQENKTTILQSSVQLPVEPIVKPSERKLDVIMEQKGIETVKTEEGRLQNTVIERKNSKQGVKPPIASKYQSKREEQLLAELDLLGSDEATSSNAESNLEPTTIMNTPTKLPAANNATETDKKPGSDRIAMLRAKFENKPEMSKSPKPINK